MSVVTNVIVITQLAENRQLLDDLGFEQIDQHAGGDKFMELEIWAAAFNHMDPEVPKRLRQFRWNEPVVILVQEQEDLMPQITTLQGDVS